VSEINDVVSAIASGADEQSVGLQEINDKVGEIDQVTQQNAAMVKGFGRRRIGDGVAWTRGRRPKASPGRNRGQDMALFGRARPMGI
jgi:hypothetical protein